jgi:hypothetical protein
MTNSLISNLPKSAMRNRNSIENSKVCGCYHCKFIFQSTRIEDWTDQDATAICPNCGVDSVISDSQYVITLELLEEAQKHWF